MKTDHKKDIEDIYPLSPLQKGMLFHHLYDKKAGTYIEQLVLHIQGNIDVENYKKAWNWVIERHPILRTVFVWEKIDDPIQIVKRKGRIDLIEKDWSHLKPEELAEQLKEYSAADQKKGFDLTIGPIMRTTFIRAENNEMYMVWSYHHILIDGWSVTQVNNEVLVAYDAYVNNREPFLPETRPYRDYIAWLRKRDNTKTAEYWKNTLKGIRSPTSIKDASISKSDKKNNNVDNFGVYSFKIPAASFSEVQSFAKSNKLTVNTLVQGAWALLLSHYSGSDDVVFGVTVSGRPSELRSFESMVGLFINNLPTRIKTTRTHNKIEWLSNIQKVQLDMQEFGYNQLTDIQGWSDVPRGVPLFESFVNFENQPMGDSDANSLGDLKILGVKHNYSPTGYPLAVFIEPGKDLTVRFLYDKNVFDKTFLARLAGHFENLLEGLINATYKKLNQIPILNEEELIKQIVDVNNTSIDYPTNLCLHQLIEEQTHKTPDAVAIQYLDETLTYKELDEKANQIANFLIEKEIKTEEIVGVMMDRSLEMLVCLIGILKSGATYLPLDPAYPSERLNFMIEDSNVRYILTQSYLDSQVSSQLIPIDSIASEIENKSKAKCSAEVSVDNLAYLIYTSGSTGKPKGVMVTHRNAVNFCSAMDELFPSEDKSKWLAVTSITFDISVLELFWTLSRGEKVHIRGNNDFNQALTKPNKTRISARKMDFSLFYFASNASENEANKYHLLLEGAKFGDKNGFSAIWTPERHFHEFGGLYPQPAVTGAAISSITENINIRAGSVVLPLTHPIRVAESWSMIDNISGGRTGLSLASGWHVDDFIFAPDNFKDRHNILFEGIEDLRKLWRGEKVKFTGGAGNEVEVNIHPRPIQKDIPIWVTAAGNPETFRKAGEIGANLLTHLLGQSLEDLENKIRIYRTAWKEAGHDGEGGIVTLMIHTFVWSDKDSVVATVKEPFKQYLNSSVGLINNLAKGMGMDTEVSQFTEKDREALLEHAFNRYFETSGLFGTPEQCLEIVENLKNIDVDEVACLIDFGINNDTVLESLNYLNVVRLLSNPKSVNLNGDRSMKQIHQRDDNTAKALPAKEKVSIARQIENEEIDHLQCTPSLMKILSSEKDAFEKLSSLKNLLLGGEALSVDLVKQLKPLSASITNMYGPTEATVWALSNKIDKDTDKVLIGKPIGNMEVYILNKQLQPLPIGVAGEIYLGGIGITRGYRNRPQITAENFVPNPFGNEKGDRIYKTGDLGRLLENDEVEFLGRIDNQVKIRGHRIESGEIEHALTHHPEVKEAIVVAKKDSINENILVAFLVLKRQQQISNSEWIEHLGKKLPDYMIPAVFTVIDEMPLTPNGKINRKALTEQSTQSIGKNTEITTAQTELEKELVEVWGEMLQVENIGTNQNFFESGGHSLLATRLVSRIRQTYKVEVELQDFFEKPTILELADKIKQLKDKNEEIEKLPQIKKIENRDNLPLSFAQQRLWFLHKLMPEDIGYNISVPVKLDGELNISVLEKTLNEIVKRHEILRTTYDVRDKNSVQIINEFEEFALPITSLENVEPKERFSNALEILQKKSEIPFDLTKGPVFRSELIKLSKNENIVLLTMHHIVSDAWSRAVLIEEFSEIYKYFSKNQNPKPLPMPEIQYADYAMWQRDWFKDYVLEKQLHYWKEQLENTEPLELPLDFPRPNLQTSNGARHEFKLNEQLTSALKEISTTNKVTFYTTLLATFQILLSKYSRQKDIAVGTLVAGRQHLETDKLLGFFINTLVMRANIRPELTFKEFITQVKNTTIKGFAHQDLPFEKLVDEIQPHRDLSRNPLFQASFNLQNAPTGGLDLDNLSMEIIPLHIKTTQFDLALEMREVDDQINAFFEYNSDLFKEQTIKQMSQRYLHLLQEIIEKQEGKIGSLNLINDEEKQEFLLKNNVSSLDIDDVNLVDTFEKQLLKTPSAIAVSDQSVSLSYLELNQQANQLAHHLRFLGVGRESLVGLYFERDVSLLVAILAVLKAGGGYVPLDPAYPNERLNYMAEDSKIVVVIRNCDWKEGVKLDGIKQEVDLRDEAAKWRKAEENKGNLNEEIIGEQLAYVIYTSGSTGKPKGVVVPHNALNNYIDWATDYYKVSEGNGSLVHSSLSFDLTITGLILPIMSGTEVKIIKSEPSIDKLAEGISENNNLSLVKLTPAHLNVLVHLLKNREIDKTVKSFVIGGEALFYEQLEFWQKAIPGVRLINEYGPTETVVGCVIYEAGNENTQGAVPIGKPINNTKVYVLDKNLNTVPTGVIGELFIGGGGVTRGYLNKPELTAGAFLPNPFESDGYRMYKTGDLVRYGNNGVLEYLGRNDNQVKIKGYRIELGEIESSIKKTKDVTECVVLVKKNTDTNESELIGYVETNKELDISEFKKKLEAYLPIHMIPQAYVVLESIPLTKNGKIDRKKLSELEDKAQMSVAEYIAPKTATEKTLALIWSDILGVEKISILDNFFDLGGDSIRSVRVVALAKEHGLNFTVQKLFKDQTIEKLAESLRENNQAIEKIERTEPFSLITDEDKSKLGDDVEDAYPLAMIQAGMLYHMELTPDSPAYLNVNSWHLKAVYNEAALMEAFQIGVDRHKVLRTSFDLTNFSQPIQIVHKNVKPILIFDDISHLSFEKQEKYLNEFHEAERKNMFDLSLPTQMRFHIHRRTDETFQFSFTENHAIIDGWSTTSTLAEIFEHYLDLADGKTPQPKEDISIEYRDFIKLEQKALADQESKKYWSGILENATPATLPKCTKIDSLPNGKRIDYLSLTVEKDLLKNLTQTAKSLNVPLKTLLFAAHIKAMSMMSGLVDFTTGITTNGRPEESDGTRVRGNFLNTVPFRFNLEQGTWADLIQRVFQAEWEMIPHRRYPLGAMQKDSGQGNLIETAFAFLHFHSVEGILKPGKIEILADGSVDLSETNFPLQTVFIVSPVLKDSLAWLQVQIDTYRTSIEARENILNCYRRTLEAIAENPFSNHSALENLGDEDKQKVIYEFNQTAVKSEFSTVIELFRNQVKTNPTATAIKFDKKVISYAKLDEESNKLSAYLIDQGIVPESTVALIMRRSPKLLISILAILKAGAAYLPIDPSNPDERIEYILDDSKSSFLLTDGILQERGLDKINTKIIDIEKLDLKSFDIKEKSINLNRNNLAYIIYTSGSTGKPKGTLITHEGLTNYLKWCIQDYEKDKGKGAPLHSSVSFDLSVTTLFLPIITGKYVDILSDDVGVEALISAMNSQPDYSFIKLTPTQLELLNRILPPEKISDVTSTLIIGGENLKAETLKLWQKNSPDTQIVNEYGPTETVVGCSTFEVGKTDLINEDVPIGKPIINTSIFILDPYLHPVPIGSIGEIYITGKGLARGYLDRQELTAEKFIPNPFSLNKDDSRMYRSGDIGRFREDGTIEYLGRKDKQIKIRGFRVEIGEIESVVGSHPQISVAVVTDYVDQNSDTQLVTYVVTDKEISQREIKQWLRTKLPDYMIPDKIIELDELPLAVSGKIDYKALPSPQEKPNTKSETAKIPPRNEVETIIHEIWKDVLKVEDISIQDNFFDLGGDSFKVYEVHAKLREKIESPFTILDIFQYPTIDTFADFLSQNNKETDFDEVESRAEKRKQSRKRRGRASAK